MTTTTTPTFHSQAKPNELWQDAEGTVYSPYKNGWLALGCPDEIIEGENELLALPMIRLMLADGSLDPVWINPRTALATHA